MYLKKIKIADIKKPLPIIEFKGKKKFILRLISDIEIDPNNTVNATLLRLLW